MAVRDKTSIPLSGNLSIVMRLTETTNPGKSTTIGIPLMSVMAPRAAGVTMSRL